MKNDVVYKVSTCAAGFHNSSDFVRALMGPVGCGKSVACCWDIFFQMQLMTPCKDGIRRSRYLVLRDSYPELKSTTIRTWNDWFGGMPGFERIKFDSPIVQKIKYADIESEILFMPVNVATVEKLGSLELSGAYMNEARGMPKVVFDRLTQRVGRYPSAREFDEGFVKKIKALNAPIIEKFKSGNLKSDPALLYSFYRKFVVMDTNPPDDMHWFYNLFEMMKPNRYSAFKYEPAVIKTNNSYMVDYNQDYVNFHNPGYYEDMIAGKDDDEIRVQLMGLYGSFNDGKPVFPEYNDNFHASDEAQPIQGQPLYLGVDFGLTPACVIGQLTLDGRLLILDEIQGYDTNVRSLFKDMVMPLLSTKYAGFSIELVLCDPSGVAKDTVMSEFTHIGILRELGFNAMPAKTNDPQTRLNAVKSFLTKLVDGKMGFVINKNCKMLRRGLSGQYSFKRVKGAMGEAFHSKPDKNQYSHLADALQYLCMAFSYGISQNNNVVAGILSAQTARHRALYG